MVATETIFVSVCVCVCAGARVVFRFIYSIDYILPGSTFLFREGRAKGAFATVTTMECFALLKCVVLLVWCRNRNSYSSVSCGPFDCCGGHFITSFSSLLFFIDFILILFGESTQHYLSV